jgi:hypothetical protein
VAERFDRSAVWPKDYRVASQLHRAAVLMWDVDDRLESECGGERERARQIVDDAGGPRAADSALTRPPRGGG